MWIVLARATDEQVAMHVRERRLRIREIQLVLEIQLRPQNASLVTVTRARDGARIQSTAHKLQINCTVSQRTPERRCERNAP